MMAQGSQYMKKGRVTHSRGGDVAIDHGEIAMLTDYTDDDGPMIEHMHDG